jgi:hypothetical protein
MQQTGHTNGFGSITLNVVPANAGTHTPRLINKAMGLIAFATISGGGYGSPRSRGRRVEARSSSTNCFGFNCQTATHFAATASRSRRASHASFISHVRPKIRGRRECRAPRSLACSVKNTRVSHHGRAGSPGIPRAMVLTVSFGLSPVIGLSCHRRPADYPAKLDVGVEASGPHDFAVRDSAARLWRCLRPPHPVPRP